MQEKTLGDLIEAARHSGGAKPLSYEALAKKCEGKPTAARLQQYVSTGLKNFPDPVSIQGLSAGLSTTTLEIILASARSLELQIDDGAKDSPFINGISSLPITAQESLKSIGLELVKLARNAESHAPQEPKQPDTKLTHIHRSVPPTSDTSEGQKNDDPAHSDYVISKIRELRKIKESTPEARSHQSAMIMQLASNSIEAKVRENKQLAEWIKDQDPRKDNPVSLTEKTPEEVAGERLHAYKSRITEAREFRLLSAKYADTLAELFNISNDSIIELHGAEAEKHPAPPIESLAAHPKLETEHEKFERQHGKRGEENQDLEA